MYLYRESYMPFISQVKLILNCFCKGFLNYNDNFLVYTQGDFFPCVCSQSLYSLIIQAEVHVMHNKMLAIKSEIILTS